MRSGPAIQWEEYIMKKHLHPTQGGCGRTNNNFGRPDFVALPQSEQCLKCRDRGMYRKEIIHSDVLEQMRRDSTTNKVES